MNILLGMGTIFFPFASPEKSMKLNYMILCAKTVVNSAQMKSHSKVSQMEEATLFLDSNKYLVKLNH